MSTLMHAPLSYLAARALLMPCMQSVCSETLLPLLLPLLLDTLLLATCRCSILSWVLVVVSGLFTIQMLGINIQPLLAVGGASSIIIGLATQTLLSNAVTGMSIVSDAVTGMSVVRNCHAHRMVTTASSGTGILVCSRHQHDAATDSCPCQSMQWSPCQARCNLAGFKHSK